MARRPGDEEAMGSNEKSTLGNTSPAKSNSSISDGNADKEGRTMSRHDELRKSVSENPGAKLRNPLHGIPRDRLFADVERLAQEKGLMEHVELLKKGAVLAQDQSGFEVMDLTEEEKVILRREKTHRWSQPFMMYFMTSKILPSNTTWLLLISSSSMRRKCYCPGYGSNGCQWCPTVLFQGVWHPGRMASRPD